MSYDPKAKLREIDRNLTQFLQQLPSLMASHAGKYALLRDCHVVEFYDSAIDAQIAGNQQFDDSLFSVQQVTDVRAEMGCYSYAVR